MKLGNRIVLVNKVLDLDLQCFGLFPKYQFLLLYLYLTKKYSVPSKYLENLNFNLYLLIWKYFGMYLPLTLIF